MKVASLPAVFLLSVALACCDCPDKSQINLTHEVEQQPPSSVSSGVIPEGVKPGQPMKVGGEVTPPIVVERFEPNFQRCIDEKRIGADGPIIVEAIISDQGLPQEVRAVPPSHGCFADEAVAAVKKWRFKPGMFRGKPVSVVFNMTVNIHWR